MYEASNPCRSDGPEKYVVQYDVDMPKDGVVDVGADGSIDGVRRGSQTLFRFDGRVVRVRDDEDALSMYAATRTYEQDLRWFNPLGGGGQDLVGLIQRAVDRQDRDTHSLDEGGYRFNWALDRTHQVASWTVRPLKQEADQGAIEWRYTVLSGPTFSSRDIEAFVDQATDLVSLPAAPVLRAASTLDKGCIPEAKPEAMNACIRQKAADLTVLEWMDAYGPTLPTC